MSCAMFSFPGLFFSILPNIGSWREIVTTTFRSEPIWISRCLRRNWIKAGLPPKRISLKRRQPHHSTSLALSGWLQGQEASHWLETCFAPALVLAPKDSDPFEADKCEPDEGTPKSSLTCIEWVFHLWLERFEGRYTKSLCLVGPGGLDCRLVARFTCNSMVSVRDWTHP